LKNRAFKALSKKILKPSLIVWFTKKTIQCDNRKDEELYNTLEKCVAVIEEMIREIEQKEKKVTGL
jgi:hypothetical protein